MECIGGSQDQDVRPYRIAPSMSQPQRVIGIWLKSEKAMAGAVSRESVLEAISVLLLHRFWDELYMQGDESGLPYQISWLTERGSRCYFGRCWEQ